MKKLKEMDQKFAKLSEEMTQNRHGLEQTIKKGVLQINFDDDFKNFDLMSQTFDDLKRDKFGIIMNDKFSVEKFIRVVLDDHLGAERTYTNFHQLLTGDTRVFNQQSIFEAGPEFCPTKDYFLFVMQRLFMFDTIAKTMVAGANMDPKKIRTFAKLFIDVEQKHIEACGCKLGKIPKMMTNLQLLVAQPSPKTSGVEFYDHIIAKHLISRSDLQKLNLLYKAKQFDYSPTVLTKITSYPMEVFEMIYNLANANSLDINLPLLENKLICTEGCQMEYNKNYGGNDLLFKRVGSAQACADLCSSTPGGLFWSWNQARDKICSVKSSDSGRHHQPGAVSGNSECGCQIEEDTEYWSNDIRTKKGVQSLQACADLCASTPGGSFWSWENLPFGQRGGTCRVKNSDSGKVRHQRGSFSGNRECGVFRGCRIEDNMNYFGNDIMFGKKVESLQACADLCSSTPGGLFWTWHENGDKFCWVKSSNSGRRQQDGTVSGTKECG